MRPKSKVQSPKSAARFTPLPPRSLCSNASTLQRSNASTLQRSNAPTLQRSNAPTLQRSNAFTLIELMVVMGVMAILMTISVPSILRVLRKDSLRKAAAEVQEVCMNARARAILNSSITEVVFHPQEKRFEFSGSSGPSPSGGEAGSPAPSGSGLSGQLPDNIVIEMLDVNLMEFKDADQVHVRFYPNGTCDELTLILRAMDSRSVDDQLRIITTEVTTGLTSVETDPTKLLSLKR
jgi:prepilin-type N-terminal cleavage/methylation domain-containing protein